MRFVGLIYCLSAARCRFVAAAGLLEKKGYSWAKARGKKYG